MKRLLTTLFTGGAPFRTGRRLTHGQDLFQFAVCLATTGWTALRGLKTASGALTVATDRHAHARAHTAASLPHILAGACTIRALPGISRRVEQHCRHHKHQDGSVTFFALLKHMDFLL